MIPQRLAVPGEGLSVSVPPASPSALAKIAQGRTQGRKTPRASPCQVPAAPKMAAAASGPAPSAAPPPAPTSAFAPEVEVVAAVGARTRSLETAGALSPWRPGRSPSGTRVSGRNASKMGPAGLGGSERCQQCFHVGGRLGHPGGRETGRRACWGRGGRVQAQAL